MSEDEFSVDYQNGEFLIVIGRNDIVDRFDLLVLARNRCATANKLIRQKPDEDPVEIYNDYFKPQEKMEAVARQKARQETRNERHNRRIQRGVRRNPLLDH